MLNWLGELAFVFGSLFVLYVLGSLVVLGAWKAWDVLVADPRRRKRTAAYLYMIESSQTWADAEERADRQTIHPPIP